MKTKKQVTKKTAVKLTAKEKEARKAKLYASEYGQNVLTINAELKKEAKSLGGARAILKQLVGDKLTDVQTAIIEASFQKKNYEFMLNHVRSSKSGNYSPFFILQSMHKHYNDYIVAYKLPFETRKESKKASK